MEANLNWAPWCIWGVADVGRVCLVYPTLLDVLLIRFRDREAKQVHLSREGDREEQEQKHAYTFLSLCLPQDS